MITEGLKEKVKPWLAYARGLQNNYGLVPIIAGGCLRDALLNEDRYIKDIDIFICQPRYNAFDKLGYLKLIDKIGCETELDVDHTYDADESHDQKSINDNILEVYNDYGENPDQPFNLVFLDGYSTPRNVIDTFDIGLCQIALDTGGQFWYSRDFVRDVMNETITVLKSRSPERKALRIDRMKHKYPTYTVEDKSDVIKD